MANTKKVSSAPLFGSSTPAQIRDIQGRIRAATARHAKSRETARALLVKVGALTEDNANQ